MADTTGDTGTPFALLDGIATEQLSVQEMAATRGEGDGEFSPIMPYLFSLGSDETVSVGGIDFVISQFTPAFTIDR